MQAGKLGAWLILMVWGCGGGSAAGEGASTATDRTASAAEDEAAGGGEAAAEERSAGGGGDEAESTEGEASALDGDDLLVILQNVLNDPKLIDDLRLEKPGRKPLKVAGPNLPAKLQVVVGSHEVKVVDEPRSIKEAVLVFTKLERTGNQARVHYRFDVEGLKGRASLSLKDGRWELASNRVVTQ
jgi:hypothetical protein